MMTVAGSWSLSVVAMVMVMVVVQELRQSRGTRKDRRAEEEDEKVAAGQGVRYGVSTIFRSQLKNKELRTA
jgi:hypothetical protein